MKNKKTAQTVKKTISPPNDHFAIIKKQAAKNKNKTEKSKLNLIYKLLRERHELHQVCLQIYKELRQTDKMTINEFCWESELERVLFDTDIFLYCNRDLPPNFDPLAEED